MKERSIRLTHLLGHLLHDGASDVGYGCVAQALEGAVFTIQLHGANASKIGMRIQVVYGYQERQQQQR